MSNLPAIYLARMDVDPAALLRFMNWYEHKHAPDTISVGFYSSQGYHSRIGKPFILNVYEIEDAGIFHTQAYQHMRSPESDPERPGILEHVHNRSNTVYRQIHTIGVPEPPRPWSEGSRIGGVDAPTVTSVRFDTEQADDDAVIEWVATRSLSRLKDRPGFKAARLCRWTGQAHPANPWVGEWATIVEWDDEDSAEAATRDDRDPETFDAPFIRNGSVGFNLAVRVTSIITRGDHS